MNNSENTNIETSDLTASELKEMLKLLDKHGKEIEEFISWYCCKHCKFNSEDCEEIECEFFDFDKCVDYFFGKKFGEICINDFFMDCGDKK